MFDQLTKLSSELNLIYRTIELARKNVVCWKDDSPEEFEEICEKLGIANAELDKLSYIPVKLGFRIRRRQGNLPTLEVGVEIRFRYKYLISYFCYFGLDGEADDDFLYIASK